MAKAIMQQGPGFKHCCQYQDFAHHGQVSHAFVERINNASNAPKSKCQATESTYHHCHCLTCTNSVCSSVSYQQPPE